jgi:hypothetical protein
LGNQSRKPGSTHLFAPMPELGVSNDRSSFRAQHLWLCPVLLLITGYTGAPWVQTVKGSVFTHYGLPRKRKNCHRLVVDQEA